MVVYQVWAVCNACGDNPTMGTAVSYPVSSSNKISHEHFLITSCKYSCARGHKVVLSEAWKTLRPNDDKRSLWRRVAEGAEPSRGLLFCWK
jgi:hypothetical protein